MFLLTQVFVNMLSFSVSLAVYLSHDEIPLETYVSTINVFLSVLSHTFCLFKLRVKS